MKRFLSTMLVFVLTLGLFSTVKPTQVQALQSATWTESLQAAKDSADVLEFLGLYQINSETDSIYERVSTNAEALVLVLRALGLDSFANMDGFTHPYTTVPEWADKYVAYAYSKGYIKEPFDPNGVCDSQTFLRYVLTAMGYTEGIDYVNNSLEDILAFANSLDLINQNVSPQLFMRGDMILICYDALFSYVNGTNEILVDKLLAQGIVDADIFNALFEVSLQDIPADNQVDTAQPDSSNQVTDGAYVFDLNSLYGVWVNRFDPQDKISFCLDNEVNFDLTDWFDGHFSIYDSIQDEYVNYYYVYSSLYNGLESQRIYAVDNGMMAVGLALDDKFDFNYIKQLEAPVSKTEAFNQALAEEAQVPQEEPTPEATPGQVSAQYISPEDLRPLYGTWVFTRPNGDKERLHFADYSFEMGQGAIYAVDSLGNPMLDRVEFTYTLNLLEETDNGTSFKAEIKNMSTGQTIVDGEILCNAKLGSLTFLGQTYNKGSIKY